MYQLISFLQNYKYLLFFIGLLIIALTLTISNNNFHKSKFINSANFITGGLYQKSSNISNYFHLKEQNEALALENVTLKNQVALLNSAKDISVETTHIDSIHFNQKYVYSSAKIIKNEYTKPNNFLTINRGLKNGIAKEMAVFNTKGIIGITEETSKNYARVQSILNKSSKINARLKNDSNYFGPLIWDGKDYKKVQLTDIPKQANIKIGDTIVTSGRSTIFPEGILVGTVLEINNNNSADNKISVQLFNDMSNLRDVYIVKNLHKSEIKSLEDE